MASIRLLVPSLLVLACGPQSEARLGEDELGEASTELTLAPGAAEQILSLVNYPGTDLGVLDAKVGLDLRAAKGLLAHRDGVDGVSPSLDDNLFDTIAELDAVPYVAASAFQKLLTYATANPAPAAERVEGVAFKGWEAEIVLWGVNKVEIGVLNGMLDVRAAQNLIANRPYTSLTQLGLVALVGPSALDRLRREARVWWRARAAHTVVLAGTFDGVSFDEATAKKALELANTASAAQLVSKGVYAAGANAIVAGRPFQTLAAVAALSGVGAASMQALASWAQAGNGPTLAETVAALQTASAGIWMPSETDAIFVVLEGQQANGAPITEALVRAQFTAQHDAQIANVMYTDPSQRSLAAKTEVEVRDAYAMIDRIIGNADPEDEVSTANAQKFAVLKQVLAAQLTDVQVYRFGRISISTMIVGRTKSGELVALLTGQVET